MSKKKYDFNGTLLNLLLLGGAAVILKNRTGSLRGVAGIGELTPKYNMVYVLVANNKYHDGWHYKIINVFETLAEAKEAMKKENYEAFVRVYEDFYQKPLVYGES